MKIFSIEIFFSKKYTFIFSFVSVAETRTIQEAIKMEAKKLAPVTNNNTSSQKSLYKEFLLPGQVYQATATFQPPKLEPPPHFAIPDGFVTPCRATPHR